MMNNVLHMYYKVNEHFANLVNVQNFKLVQIFQNLQNLEYFQYTPTPTPPDIK